jgi:hypothetical protein
MFYAYLDSRAGEEVKDSQCEVIGRRHAVLVRPPLQYRFAEPSQDAEKGLNVAYPEHRLKSVPPVISNLR